MATQQMGEFSSKQLDSPGLNNARLFNLAIEYDKEKNACKQIITIGEEKKKRSRMHQLQLIQEAMSRKQER